MDVAGFNVVDLLPFPPLHLLLLLPLLLLLLLNLLLHPQLEVVVNGPSLILGLCPQFPLLFHHLPLALDKFIREIILKQMRLIVFDASRWFRRNDGGEQPLFRLLSKLQKQRRTFSNSITGGSLTKDGIRCTGYIRCSGG